MSAVRNYAVVTASYWGFTLTDGALRMLVLLHFYSLGYTPFPVGVSVSALRDRRHLRQSRRRLARHALRHPAHADDWPDPADHRPAAALGAQSHLERGLFGRVGGRCARDRGRGERSHQDGLEIRDQGHVGRRLWPVVPVGRLVHRVQECHEGRGLFLRGPAVGNPWLPGCLVAHGRRPRRSFSSVWR